MAGFYSDQTGSSYIVQDTTYLGFSEYSTGALPSPWTAVQGQTPRDIAVKTDSENIVYETAGAIVAPEFYYNTAITRPDSWRISASLRFNSAAGISRLHVINLTGIRYTIQVTQADLTHVRVIIPFLGTTDIVVPTMVAGTYYRAGLEKIAQAVNVYWNPSGNGNPTLVPNDSSLSFLAQLTLTSADQSGVYPAVSFSGAALSGTDYNGIADYIFSNLKPATPVLPAAGGSGGSVQSAPFTPYTRYKNIRQAVQIYNQLVLTP